MLIPFLLLSYGPRVSKRFLFLFAGVFAATFLSALYVNQPLFVSFLRNSLLLVGPDAANLSVLGTFRHIGELLALPPAGPILYCSWCAAVVGISARTLQERRNASSAWTISFVLLSFVLIVPRLEPYGLLALVPASYYVASRNVALFALNAGEILLPYLANSWSWPPIGIGAVMLINWLFLLISDEAKSRTTADALINV